MRRRVTEEEASVQEITAKWRKAFRKEAIGLALRDGWSAQRKSWHERHYVASWFVVVTLWAVFLVGLNSIARGCGRQQAIYLDPKGGVTIVWTERWGLRHGRYPAREINGVWHTREPGETEWTEIPFWDDEAPVGWDSQ